MHKDIEIQLQQVEPLIVQIVRRRLRGWPKSHFDDLCQEIRIALWLRVLPRFDPSRGKLESFASIAIHRIISSELRRITSETHLDQLPEEFADAEPIARDESAEQLGIIDDALQYLKDADSQLVRELLKGGADTNPTTKTATKHQRKSRALKRLRQVIRSRFSRPAA